MKTRRFLSFLLVIVLFLTCVPVASATTEAQAPATEVTYYELPSDLPTLSAYAEITVSGDYVYFTLNPSFSGYVYFESTSGTDPRITILDADYNQLAFDDDSGDSMNFALLYYVTSGTQYYIKIDNYGGSTGTINFVATRVYSISYDANGGTGAPDVQAKLPGEDITLSSTVPTRTGCTFQGWALSSTATTAAYQPGDLYTRDADATLYAVWYNPYVLPSNLTVYSGSAEVTTGGEYIYYSFTPSFSGKVHFESFTGSDTKIYIYGSDGSQLTYDDDSGEGLDFALTCEFTAGEAYTVMVRYYSSSTTGTINFTATRVYDITYDANGGSGAPSAQTKLHGQALTLSDGEPTRTDYTFLGWATTRNATSATYQPGGTYTANSSKTLYAVWRSNLAPHIYTQPTGQKVKAGTTATFSVSADGAGLTYQWQYRTSASGTWQNTTATGAKTATLKVAATCAKSGYQYRCKISSSNGTVTYTNVVYMYVLGIKTQPTTQSVYPGTTATFSVVATGHNKTFQWQYRTGPNGTWKNTTATGAKTANLKVVVTAAKNGYQYRCKITDSVGNVIYSNVATMAVFSGDFGIVSQPVTRKVKDGATATFSVTATGAGLTYQWQYRTSASGTWKNCTATGNKTATMKVPATCAKSGYQYRCKVTNGAGNVQYTSTVYLYVLGIKTHPVNFSAKAGTNATFSVVATGHNKTYQWQYSTDGGQTWKNTTATGAKTATLTVAVTATKFGYMYRCKVTDSAGNVIFSNGAFLYQYIDNIGKE